MEKMIPYLDPNHQLTDMALESFDYLINDCTDPESKDAYFKENFNHIYFTPSLL